MNGLNVAPTKSNFLDIKKDLALAQEGFELLDHKREVLIHELMRYIHELKTLQHEINQEYQKFFRLFNQASVKLGEERLRLNLNFKSEKLEPEVIFRSIMGIRVPQIQQKRKISKPPISGLEDSCVELQQCINMMDKLYDILITYIQTEATVWRLAVEVKKTQRRVRSLENIAIPQYEQTLKIIGEVLEESERESFFRMKRVKSKITG